MSKPVRVRFAPSPTGFLHLGNLRSALFDYLYAQNQGGNFILRLEDTDRERFVPESVKFIEENLKWLGLDWDEGIEVGGPHEPYIQSERIGIYKKHAEELVNKGLAYRDYTTPEELAELRGRAEAEKRPFKFTKEMARTEAKGDEKFVIRFTIQPGDDVVWKDAVWGEQKPERARRLCRD
jgi:glutamyl-tRNA synthetase